jgi:glycosyltransferase involved in cell wall biosynthesis
LQPSVYVIIPAFNEEKSIAKVIAEIPTDLITEVIVVDNASSDQTAAVARSASATVLHEPEPGYGRACLKGIRYCKAKIPAPDIIVFLDGDYSDYPEEIRFLIKPIVENNADLVIGSRALGKKEKGSMTPQQVFGNWLATGLLRLLYKIKFTDLGPFRAIRFSSLVALNMQDKTFGWTVEMQLKCAKQCLRCVEVPVRYRRRIGISKISGTLKGTVMAGYKILLTIFRYL